MKNKKHYNGKHYDPCKGCKGRTLHCSTTPCCDLFRGTSHKQERREDDED